MTLSETEDATSCEAVTAEYFAMLMEAFALVPEIKAPEAKALETITIAVAVSGGPDSMALCRLAQEWAVPRGVKVVGLTVDHRLRDEAAVEAATVSQWLDAIDVPHETLVWQEGATVKQLDRSPQAAARDARFDLMTTWCGENNVTCLLTAHHADDQAETFLMRLIRGSGVDGLAAMSGETARGGMRVLRPLLTVTKTDLISTCKRFNQPWVHDPSNDNDSYARTRIRNVMAALESEGLHRDRLLKTVTHMQRAQTAIESAVTDVMELAAKAGTKDESAGLTVDVAVLCSAPDEVALRGLARCLKTVSGAPYAPRFDSLERVFRDLKGSLKISSNGDPKIDMKAGEWTDRTLHGCQLRLATGYLTVTKEGQRR